jgi:CRP-like cAMP-binding protein
MLGPANDKNAFLSDLPAAEYALLHPYLIRTQLRVGQYLHCIGDLVDDVVFPDSGLVAISMPLRDKPGAAAALIGRDGIVGALAAFADMPAASDAVVHMDGDALRLPVHAFRQWLEQNPALSARFALHTQALCAQSQLNAVCHAVHPVEARVCRWLLAILARCGGDKVPLIQETLAQMLGVRRTTVTLIGGRLEAAGVISCRRGYIRIIDQRQLEQRSCECDSILNGYLSKLLPSSAEAVPGDEGRSTSGHIRRAVQQAS